MNGALGAQPDGKALCFEDQYASTGGQLYELIAGHDRFVADLRPLRPRLARARDCHGRSPAIRTTSAARSDRRGERGDRDGPFRSSRSMRRSTVDADVAWVGYANAKIRAAIEPLLQQELRARGWLATKDPP